MKSVNLRSYRPGWRTSLSILLLLLVSGCGGGGGGGSAGAGTTNVTISFGVPVAKINPSLLPEERLMLAAVERDGSLLQQYGRKLSDLLIPNAVAAPAPAGLASIKVTITGPGMTTIVDIIAVTPGTTVTRNYSVPSGVNRNFLIQAYSGAGATGNLMFQGNTLVANLQPGVPVTLNVPMTATDQTPPVITLTGASPVTVAVGATYTDAGATAQDNVDGNITANIVTVNPVNTAAVGTYTVTYNVSDAAGNAATQVTRTVNVTDQTAPVITMLGSNPVTVTQNATYVDAGATATDNVDGNITANIVTTNPVNTAAVGTYTVTYNVSDAATNAATPVTRTVNVQAATAPVAGVDWKWANPKPMQEAFAAVAFNGSIYVAVGDVGNIFTSADGITWIEQNSGLAPPRPHLRDVLWDGSKFVAVGNNSTLLTSPDGVTWTAVGVAATLTPLGVETSNLSTVEWSGSMLVILVEDTTPAGGTVIGGAILTSTDGGATWTGYLSSILKGITWNGTQFVAVGSDVVVTSTDGITWTQQSLANLGAPPNVNLLDVAWNGTNLFVAVGEDLAAGGTSVILSSADGITWTRVVLASSPLHAVIWDGTKFVAAGDGGEIFTSADGATWAAAANTGTSIGLEDVIWTGTQYVAVGSPAPLLDVVVSPIILTSADAATWTPRIAPSAAYWLYDIAWNGTNLFVAVGSSGTIMTSPDGATWTAQTSNTASLLYGVAWNGGVFVAVGSGGTILISANGVGWTQQISGTTATLNDVVWNGTQFVAVGGASVLGGNATILTSPGGSVGVPWTWTPRTSGTTNALNGVAWDGTNFITVGARGTILTSLDGAAWRALTSGTASALNDVVWDGVNQQFLVVGAVSAVTPTVATILTSPGGAAGPWVWTAQNSSSLNDLNSVVWSGTQYVAVGISGETRTSATGTTASWTKRASRTNNALLGTAWDGTRFVTVGENGAILVSP